MPALLPFTKSYPAWEILRTLAARLHAGPVWTDRIWDHASHRFDTIVAQRHVPHCDAVIAFEYTALASFESAARLGRARILHLPSMENRGFRAIELREKQEWPEQRTAGDAYFARKFEARQIRRQKEIALAEVILVNSALTKRSHVAAGADPCKIQVVPLGAPAPIAVLRPPPRSGPLKVLWSGSFMLRKGALYLIEAWRKLAAGANIRLDVYGSVGLPPAALAELPDGIVFHGSVPREDMLRAYEDADVLVFPTLSDGFGMVVAEALSRGLPVITTDQAGAAELIEPGKNGFVIRAGDSAALTDVLQWCLDNRGALSDMRPAALASAARRQWSDYRRDHRAALAEGLKRAGYDTGAQSPPFPAGAVKRICIITTSALGSNPRVVKEADALSAAGYAVEVVSTRTLDRVDRYDEEIVARAAWGSERVDLRSPLRRKMLHARLFLSRALALVSAGRHFSIFGLALARLVLAKKADLYIAHYVGALPLAALAARRHGGRFAFDAEDFHLGDLPDRPEHEAEKQHIRAVEERWLGSAAYVTAASSGIADAYQTVYGIGRPDVILNCFPRNRAPAAPSPQGTAAPGPSLYWVSQTIGPGRGLECAVGAIARAASRPHLYLRGTVTGGYREQLSGLAQAAGAGDRLHFPAPRPRPMTWSSWPRPMMPVWSRRPGVPPTTPSHSATSNSSIFWRAFPH